VNLLRVKPGGFIPEIFHVIEGQPAKTQVLHPSRELHPAIAGARSMGVYYFATMAT